ncbi:MAG: DUF418 domain-containing protein [Pseudomonadales bacterium]|nr:DUF418 domain-containing protein [Pseudomonadales bacterium]
MTALSAPVTGKARIQSIDTLRGVALLGILLMNIIAFANPFAAYLIPTVDGADSGINLATFMTMDIFVEGAMRAIFSMLFGAGMLIFLNKPNSDAERTKGLYYRRTLLLVAFGLFNAYVLLWLGDILYAYGMTGLILYFFRDVPAKKLVMISAGIFLLLSIVHTSGYYQASTLGAAVDQIEALPAGTALNEQQHQTLDDWDAFLDQQFVSPDLVAQQLEVMQSGYFSAFVNLAPINLVLQTLGFVGNSFWDALAMMLLGMAFMKWGLLDASRSLRTYGLMAFIGLGIGFPLNTWESVVFVSSGFDLEWTAFNRPTYDLGRLSLAVGYIGVVMLICKLGILSWARFILARVGQMALTNYLSHSLICSFIFMGWGLGLAGQLERLEIYYVVIGIWVFQLITSPLWLHYFRFGPAEWLWRSLTYKQSQPLRIQST